MKYENTDIFTFNSYKPKKESIPASSGMEENAGLKESHGEINPEDQNMGETANSIKDISDLATSALTPDTDEELQAPLSDTLLKDCQEDISDLIPEAESDIFSDSTEAIFKSTSLSKAAPLSETVSLPSPDLSLESEALGSSVKETLPFEPFVGYDNNALKALQTSEAFGIITTGIEPLELTASGAVITGYITSARRHDIRLGTYVVVPYENGEKLFAKVGKLQYRQEFVVDDATEIHSRRMLSARGNPVNEADYKFLAYLDPLCILYLKNGGTLTRRMADRIPHPNTPILPVTDRLEVQTGLNIPEEGIFLGHLSVGGELLKTHSEPETVAYYLRNDYSMGDPLIFRHMLICGSTGTGKTFLSKNILRQFMAENNRYRLRSSPDKARKNPCLVIMDPQDEYSQLFEDNETLNEDDKFRLESENVIYGRVTSTKAFVAKVDGQRYPGDKSRAEQIEFTIPFSLVGYNSWLIAAAGMSELQYIGLEVLLGDFFRSNVPHTYLNFINHIDNEGTRSYYVDSGKLHESSYDGIVRRVRSPFFSKVFDRDATSITELLDKIFKPGQISVFPTEYISDPRIRDLIVLTIMSLIVDNKLNTTGEKAIKETPIILALDEAHRYLSKAKGEHSRLIISRFADAARQGRKEGLGLFLITQDPQDIDDTVFKQVNTKLILNLNNDAAITSLKVPKEYERRIPYLKKGQMIVHSPDNSDIVEIIGLSNCVVRHR
ncbi:MAG: ATP-binding protein [Methanosarcina flavescens]|jgi:DNA helicase HerA-like ATPase|uniref:ATP-binding protein n=1 Tax=Methanosarcina flavescens TaxID=1715806 RepID=A0A660HR85_9EURY|nr:ATP-binding protein [Methanosarcina flavescens]AYK14790.1 ATP-binding protein [Methanosarcina flavescens]NLK33282.1 ATP-binding protein [Methanosarcina flavescens]